MNPNLKCFVLGCHTRRNQGLRFYQFPCHNPQICSTWEQRICQSANIDVDILNDRVCELHFDYRCKTGIECALEEGSLPTLHLPSFGIPFSTDNAHFQMNANRIKESSYTISVKELSYHCRFCLRRELLYEVEASTYRSKSFLSLIDLPPNVLPDNTQPNACLSCLKSIVIAHQLSVAVEHSNTILQQLLQNPKQSKVVSNTNFFDIKSELTFCNLILANSLYIKLEIEFEDKIACVNEDYDQKWISTGEPTSPAAYVNTQNMVKNSICVTENQYNVSKMHDSITSDKKCPKEFHKSFAIGAVGENTTDLSAEESPNANENSDYCFPMENTVDNDEVIVSNNSFDSCAEDRQFDNELPPELPSNAAKEPTYKCDLCKFTTNYKANIAIHKNLHLAGNDKVHFCCQICEKDFLLRRHFVRHNTIVHADDFICKICDKPHPSATKLTIHCKEHQHFKYISTRVLRSGHRTRMLYHKQGKKLCTLCGKIVFSKHKCSRSIKEVCKSLKQQQKLHNSIVTRFLCNHCGKEFLQKRKLTTHNKQHAKLKNSLKCKQCPKEFETKYDHRQHLQIHRQTTFTAMDKNTHWNENDGVYICPICEWKTPSPYSFSAHMGKHVQSDKIATTETQILETLETDPTRNKDGRYQCTECPTACENKSHFIRHRLIHTNERPYKCTECPKTFRRKSHANIHKRIHTNERPYKCTKCAKTFSQHGHLNIHMRIHTTNERLYKCTGCPKTFSYKSSLVRHQRIHTNERPYKCTECQKTFRQPSILNEHKRIHTKERPYKCAECPKTFNGQTGLVRHRRIHTNERPYKCAQCPKTFSYKCSLVSHKRTHTKERPYKCTECPKTFSQSSHLSVHKRKHTKEVPYKCTECPKTFSHKSSLVTHQRIHTNERPYKCTECPKTFSYKSNLVTHNRIHTNERPYKCTQCPKTFSYDCSLVTHLRTHTNEKPYKCTECPKTFRQASNLSVHKRIHTKERPYKCTECSKTFSQSSHLNVHKRKHTNERSHICTVYSKTFSNKNNLDTHKSIHANGRPYKSTECPEKFNRKSNWDTHTRKHE